MAWTVHAISSCWLFESWVVFTFDIVWLSWVGPCQEGAGLLVVCGAAQGCAVHAWQTSLAFGAVAVQITMSQWPRMQARVSRHTKELGLRIEQLRIQREKTRKGKWKIQVKAQGLNPRFRRLHLQIHSPHTLPSEEGAFLWNSNVQNTGF